jgi:hypothetical protein
VLAALGLGFLGAALTGGVGGAITPLAVGLTGGVAGNLATDLFKHFDKKVCERFLDGWSGIDENHHIVASLRLAQIDAMRSLVATFEKSLGQNDDRIGDQYRAQFIERVKQFLSAETELAQKRNFSRDDIDAELRQTVIASLPSSFDDALAAPRITKKDRQDRATMFQTRVVAEAAVLNELKSRCGTKDQSVPDDFELLFLGESETSGWFDLFVRDAAEKITQPNSQFEAIWTVEQISLIRALVEAGDRRVENISVVIFDLFKIVESNTSQLAGFGSDIIEIRRNTESIIFQIKNLQLALGEKTKIEELRSHRERLRACKNFISNYPRPADYDINKIAWAFNEGRDRKELFSTIQKYISGQAEMFHAIYAQYEIVADLLDKKSINKIRRKIKTVARAESLTGPDYKLPFQPMDPEGLSLIAYIDEKRYDVMKTIDNEVNQKLAHFDELVRSMIDI